MKGLKILAFVAVGIVALLGIALAVALMPSVQTWAVRKAVAGQPGVTLEVDRVDAGFSNASISNLRYAKDGMLVTAKGVTAKYSAWDYLTKKRINADQVTVEELVVDLRNAKSATAATTGSSAQSTKTGSEQPKTPDAKPKTPSTAFPGVLEQAKLPFDIRVATLIAKGRALLTNQQQVTFDLTGTGIETGQRGKLEWTIDFSDSKPGADLRALRTTGTAGLHIAADRRVDLVEVDAIVAAMGPKLPADRVRLVARAEQPSAGGNEGYNATLSIIRGNQADTLFKTSAQFLTASREIAGAWELSVRSEQLAAVLAGLGLPEVAANGSGKFALKPDANVVAASGDLHGQASQLAKLSPALTAIGAVNFKTTFDAGLAGDVARVDRLEVDVTGLDGRKIADISSLQKVTYHLGNKQVTLANPRAEVARIALHALPLAWAQPVAKPMVIESGDLSLALTVEAEADGSRIRARAAEPLALRTVTIRGADQKALVEKVSLTTKPTVDYSPTRIVAKLDELNVSVPAGDTLRGHLSADVTNFAKAPIIAFAGELQGKLITLLKPHLPLDPGPLAVNAAFQGRHEGQTVNLEKASATVNRDGGALLTALQVQQPVRIDLKAMTFAMAKPDATAARVQLGEIPLAWAEAFVAKSKFAGVLTGATLDVAMRSIDDLSITTTQPLAMTGVSATLDAKPMVQSLDLVADLNATKRGDVITYDLRRLELKQGQNAVATVNVAGEAKLGKKLTLAAKGKLDADAAALMTQPVAAPFATLSRGRIAAVFDATVADATQARAVLSAKGLVAKQENRPLGDLELNVTANLKPDGNGTFSAPITLTAAGRKSDVQIDGAFGKATGRDTFLFNGKIAGNQIVVDDFQALTALAPAEPSKPTTASRPSTSPPVTRPAGGPVATTPKRDAAPFWKGVNGKVEVDIKRALHGQNVISGIRGAAMITDTKLSLDGLEGRFKESPFKLSGGLNFAAQQPKPYSLVASADVPNFDVGAALRPDNPKRKPTFETMANLTARLNGQGGTIGEVAKNVFGTFELSGKQGVTRIFGKEEGLASTAVDVAALGLAILGARNNSQSLSAGAELIQLLKEVRFDSIALKVERAADLSFKLTSIEILSPILHATGSGTVATKDMEQVANAPMNIGLQLGAKGSLAIALQKTGQLGSLVDDKGYMLMSRTFTIGGTPTSPDNRAFWSLLLEAGIGAFGR